MKNNNLYASLLDAIQSNDFKVLQQVIQTSLKLPFVVCDSNYQVLMQVPKQYFQDPLWDSMLKHNVVIPEMVYLIQEDKYQEALDDNNHLIYIDYGIGESIPRIISSILFEDKIIGYICVLLTEKFISDIDYEDITIISKFLSVYLSKVSKPNIPSNDLHFYLQNIFKMKTTDSTHLHELLSLPNELRKNFRIVYTKVSKNSNEIVYLYQLFNRVQEHPNIFSILDEEHLFLFFTDLDNTDNNGFSMHMKLILDEAKLVKLKFGISDSFSLIENVMKHKQQAIHAFAFTQSERFQFFNNILLDDIFRIIHETDSESIYLHPGLIKLKNYDSLHNSDYLLTLEVFVKHFCQSNETCKQLNIHRNSLLYRLNKIQELSDIDVKSENVLTQLLCNFYMYQL